MKPLFAFIYVPISIFILASSAFVLDFYKRADFVVPRTVIGDFALSSMSQQQARDLVRARLDSFIDEPFSFIAKDKIAWITFEDLGIVVDESAIISQIPFAARMSNASVLLWTIAGQRIMPMAAVERTEIFRIIDEKFLDIPKTKNASFGKNFKIIEAQDGLTPDVEAIVSQLKTHVAFLEHRSVIVDFKTASPTIHAADLENQKEVLLAAFPGKFALTYEKKSWEVDFKKYPERISFERKPYEVVEGELPFSLQWDPAAFSAFLSDAGINASLEQAPEGVRIWRDTEDKIQIDGHANEGRVIEKERLLSLINNALAQGKNEVEIPLAVVPPKIEISADLQAMGIRELIAVGHTRFKGSPANRKHNIGVGISKYNGLLIPPGATFSFNENLGIVDASTGYRKELVIKPEGTIPEFGGGLCQVSTTLYRAVMNAGFKIVERAPHSYAVTYYSQVGGHGLDATIYPPSRDLKFMNDTPGHILIQSYADDPDAYFKFYGTSDGRKVVLEGPYISNKRSPPSEPLIVADKELAPGEKKQVEKPHDGFDALWYRYITKDGQTTKEEILTRYKAVPAKFLVGGEVNAEGENKGLTEPVNPYE